MALYFHVDNSKSLVVFVQFFLKKKKNPQIKILGLKRTLSLSQEPGWRILIFIDEKYNADFSGVFKGMVVEGAYFSGSK